MTILILLGWAIVVAVCVALGFGFAIAIGFAVEDWRERRRDVIREPRNLFGSRK